jgi:hypothetical protein
MDMPPSVVASGVEELQKIALTNAPLALDLIGSELPGLNQPTDGLCAETEAIGHVLDGVEAIRFRGGLGHCCCTLLEMPCGTGAHGLPGDRGDGQGRQRLGPLLMQLAPCQSSGDT